MNIDNKNSINMSSLIPMVVEQSGRGERAFDIFSRLLTVLASPDTEVPNLLVAKSVVRAPSFWAEGDIPLLPGLMNLYI